MRWARLGRALGLLWLGTEGLLRLAAAAQGPLLFDVGPSTGTYGDGFTPSEERQPTTFRWAQDHAALELPLVAEAGAAQLSARLQGTVRRPTLVHGLLGGRQGAALPG